MAQEEEAEAQSHEAKEEDAVQVCRQVFARAEGLAKMEVLEEIAQDLAGALGQLLASKSAKRAARILTRVGELGDAAGRCLTARLQEPRMYYLDNTDLESTDDFLEYCTDQDVEAAVSGSRAHWGTYVRGVPDPDRKDWITTENDWCAKYLPTKVTQTQESHDVVTSHVRRVLFDAEEPPA